jgi:hypothetical protein
MKTRTFMGLPIPNPAVDGMAKPYVYDAAVQARAYLLTHRNPGSDLRLPISYAANHVAREWCLAGRHGLVVEPEDVGYLTGSVTEILSLDPATHEFLRSHGFTVPSCVRCRRYGGGR